MTLQALLKKRGFDIPVEYLPPLQVIVKDIAGVGVYFLTPKLALLGWPVTDPDAPKIDRKQALIEAFNKAEELAKFCGATRITHYTDTPQIKNVLEYRGFVAAEPTTLYMKEPN